NHLGERHNHPGGCTCHPARYTALGVVKGSRISHSHIANLKLQINTMAYTVLARRYRSGTFDEVIGQDHIAQTLKKAITSGRVAHAYLFCGTRGTGKTSM